MEDTPSRAPAASNALSLCNLALSMWVATFKSTQRRRALRVGRRGFIYTRDPTTSLSSKILEIYVSRTQFSLCVFAVLSALLDLSRFYRKIEMTREVVSALLVGAQPHQPHPSAASSVHSTRNMVL